MMRNGHGGSKALRKRVDVLFGSIFLLAALRWVVQETVTGRFAWTLWADSRFWLVAAIGLLFFLGLRFNRLRVVEPYVFLVTALLPFSQSPETVFGFGLFAVGAIMLYVDGHMRRHPVPKILLLGAYLILLILMATIYTGSRWDQAIGLILFMVGFFLYLFFTFQDRIIVFVQGNRPEVSLEDRGLTPKEVAHLLELLDGKTTKEIAFGQGVKESTVRNSLSRAYRKLGFVDKTQLLAWAENYNIRP